MMIRSVVVVALACVIASAMATTVAVSRKIADFAMLASRDDVKEDGHPLGSEMHEVVFAIKQQNIDLLEKTLFQVSDPKNTALYGRYLSRAEVANMTSNIDATNAVLKFLESNDIPEENVKPTKFGEYITVEAPISTWEKIFSTTFYKFIQTRISATSTWTTGSSAVGKGDTLTYSRAKAYTLPAELEEHVVAVFNTVQIPPALPPRRQLVPKSSSKVEKAGSITPALLNSYYNINSNTGFSGASQAVFESLGQYYSPSDLAKFESLYDVPSEEVAVDIGGYESDAECVSDANNCVEANLDVQYMMAVSQVTPTTYWYEDATDSFLAWITAVADSDAPPLVNSISYGSVENSLPKFIAQQWNTEAMKLGVQGVTVLVSSGDDGVANFNARTNPKNCGYNPSFPASSPYVTAVGATQGPESGTEEIVCSSSTGGVITTGGGFSTQYDAPSYQTSAIAGYFASVSGTSEEPESGYVATGRGYPDVSMAGLNYEVVVGGNVYQVSGTSASAPVVAGMVSLVNAARLAAGKPALGFINPAIYQFGVDLTFDVVTGENNCAASVVCCSEGFYAAAGWDPTTGFGSVNYAAFYSTFFGL